MLSFQKLYEDTQEQTQDLDTTTLVLIKRWINQGAKKFGAKLSREWRTSTRLFSTVASQQYYDLPADCIRIKTLVITIGGIPYPLEQIDDEDVWNNLNMRESTSDIPEYYYVRGSSEVGIFPTPANSNTNAASIRYERRMRDMSAADYATGTITLTNDSTTVTGAGGATFTIAMEGRWIRIDDPSGDGMWYKIEDFTNSTTLVLDRKYQGDTLAGASYVIAEIPDIPEEFHENLVDYACFRYYRRRKDRGMAREFKKDFDDALVECQADYSSSSSSQYLRVKKVPTGGYKHIKRDLTVT